jgi:putative sugar O-methyltransferase
MKKYYLGLLALVPLLVWAFWKKEPQPLSFLDNGIYSAHCQKIARDEKLFQQFKRDPFLSLFFENLNSDAGGACLDHLAQNAPDFLQFLKKGEKNDKVGAPHRIFYKPYGHFSPSTLLYLKIASDLHRLFGPLDGRTILEIGGGYGGICTILSSLYSLENYTLVDLPGALELSCAYLKKQKIEKVSFSPLTSPPHESFDFVISYLSFSELDRTLQSVYIDKIFTRAKAGFLVCSPAHWKEIPYSKTQHKRVKPLDQKQILKALSAHGIQASLLPEEPSSGKDHFIIYWQR